MALERYNIEYKAENFRSRNDQISGVMLLFNVRSTTLISLADTNDRNFKSDDDARMARAVLDGKPLFAGGYVVHAQFASQIRSVVAVQLEPKFISSSEVQALCDDPDYDGHEILKQVRMYSMNLQGVLIHLKTHRACSRFMAVCVSPNSLLSLVISLLTLSRQ